MSTVASSDLDPVQHLITEFETTRQFWRELLNKLAENYRAVSALPDTQVQLFSQRQILVEQLHGYTTTRLNRDRQLQHKRKGYLDQLREGKLGGVVRLTERQQLTWLDGQVARETFELKVLDEVISFYRETIKTVDSMLFGVKHRIELEQWTFASRPGA